MLDLQFDETFTDYQRLKYHHLYPCAGDYQDICILDALTIFLLFNKLLDMLRFITVVNTIMLTLQ